MPSKKKKKLRIIVDATGGIIKKTLTTYSKFRKRYPKKLYKFIGKRIYRLIIKIVPPKFYRNMVVYNFSPPKETKYNYPLLAEFRATYISTKKVKVIKKLNITVKNLVDYFTFFGISEREKKVIMTIGEEINKPISKGEVKTDLNYCIKYVRIKNKMYPLGREYLNDEIEAKIKTKKSALNKFLFLSKEGFVFRIKDLPRWLT